MPKSKRQKIVNLTKTDKKGREGKDVLVDAIRECVEKYQHVYIFSVENMRNTYLKDVRNAMKTSRFFFGRNKVMAKALGLTEEEECKKNIHMIANKLEGNVGLLFTNDSPDATKKFFDEYAETDYARSGVVATETVVIPAGPITRGPDNDKFPHNMEPQLRQLGMPTHLVNGIVTLSSDYQLCEKGEQLTSQQAQLLKHFYIQMAEFKVTLLCHWSNDEFTEMQ